MAKFRKMKAKLKAYIKTLPFVIFLSNLKEKLTTSLHKSLLKLFDYIAPCCTLLCTNKPKPERVGDENGEISKGLIQIV